MKLNKIQPFEIINYYLPLYHQKKLKLHKNILENHLKIQNLYNYRIQYTIYFHMNNVHNSQNSHLIVITYNMDIILRKINRLFTEFNVK